MCMLTGYISSSIRSYNRTNRGNVMLIGSLILIGFGWLIGYSMIESNKIKQQRKSDNSEV
jgi:hypothetical protein